MAEFTIEVTYHLPVYRHRTYIADTVANACRLAIEDEEWMAGKFDHDSAGESYVTGIWAGADAAYSRPPIPVPAHFGEMVQRKAEHFETLLGLLKMIVADVLAARTSSAVARGEAILAGARDLDMPAGLPPPAHVLARLEESRVRDRIAAIVAARSEFPGVSMDAVTDSDIHTACEKVARLTDLAAGVGETVACTYTDGWLADVLDGGDGDA